MGVDMSSAAATETIVSIDCQAVCYACVSKIRCVIAYSGDVACLAECSQAVLNGRGCYV